MKVKVRDYLLYLKDQLLQDDNWSKIELTREWKSKFPDAAGVYALRDCDKILYVGETGNLRGRMGDLQDSRHHTLRRTIGERFFSEEVGFRKATNKDKFPPNIEELVNRHICGKLKIAYLVVDLGRKELEELIESEIDKEIRLNKRGKRKIG